MEQLSVTTIGFTRTTAEDFFQRLMRSGVRRIIDVRLNNTSQLAGFAKARDLAFFLDRIGNIDYGHFPQLAPTDEILKDFQKKRIDWTIYEQRFLDLMSERAIETTLSPDLMNGACLLCSEHTPHECHRRLVCDYLNDRWGGRLGVQHL